MEKQNKPNKTTQRDFSGNGICKNIDTKKREKRKKRRNKGDGTNYLLFLFSSSSSSSSTRFPYKIQTK
jgi:hypothetical protein